MIMLWLIWSEQYKWSVIMNPKYHGTQYENKSGIDLKLCYGVDLAKPIKLPEFGSSFIPQVAITQSSLIQDPGCLYVLYTR